MAQFVVNNVPLRFGTDFAFVLQVLIQKQQIPHNGF